MPNTALLHATLCVATLGLCASTASRASAQGAVSIDVDATTPGPPLERVWAYHGYDEANYTTTEEGRELLRTVATLHRSAPHVRTHFLFNTGDGTPALKWGSTNIYTEDASGEAIYDFSLIDGIMDATVEAGTFPLVELGFMPQALSIEPDPYQPSNTYVLDGGSFYPPKDYDKWGALVTAWAEHVQDRYPNADSDWQWELWNEPDIGYWQGTVEEFARLYDVTEAALHGVFPDASLGGPAVANVRNEFLAQFLDHCASGTNAVSAETGTRLDMVSFHAKGGVFLQDGHVRMDLGNQLRLHRLGFDTIASSAFAKTPIVLTEADPDGCAACPVSTAPHHAYRNSPAYGAYVVAMMKRSLDLAVEADVQLKGVLTWAFTFPDTPYFAGYRALATNGIHLPVLNAFKLLGSLEGDRLSVVSTGASSVDDIVQSGVRERADVDALATLSDDRVQILVWHYHDDIVDAEPAEVTLEVSLPAAFEQHAAVTHIRVDETHGDAFTVWETQGSPEVPSASQLAQLREAMEPVVLNDEQLLEGADGKVRVSFELPRFGISLLSLQPSDGGAPPPDAGSDGGADDQTDDDVANDGSERQPSGCACGLAVPTPPPLMLLALLPALAYRRRERREPR